MNTRKTFDLPYDIQRLIFRCVSTPTADLIRNLDYEKEYIIIDNKRGGKKNYNVFGCYFYDEFFTSLNRRGTRCDLNSLERIYRLGSFGLYELLDVFELFTYCCYKNINIDGLAKPYLTKSILIKQIRNEEI